MLTESIQKRQVDDYLMQLRIVTNPHLESAHARPFVEGLMRQRDQLHGSTHNDLFDQEGLAQLKKRLGKESKMVMVK